MMPKLRSPRLLHVARRLRRRPDQSLDNPLGVGGERLHEWMFETRGGRKMIGEPGGRGGVDDGFFHQGFEGIGATVMGRNMFGPSAGRGTRPRAGVARLVG